MTKQVELPEKAEILFGTARNYVLYGGRGSGKSWAVAIYLITTAFMSAVGLRILCTREIQRSIQDSVLRLLQDVIRRLGLDEYFVVTRNEILCTRNGSLFIFEGLLRNITKIKSMEGIDICWCEESESLSQDSLDILVPTIRKPGSRIIYTFNPDQIDDPIYDMFIIKGRPNTLIAKLNYTENPWFPEVLKEERDWMRANDYEKYLWVWEGEPRTVSDALVFKGRFAVEPFDTPVGDDMPDFYHGADWGFSVDPNALIRCWIKDRRLYIDREAWQVGTIMEDLPHLFGTVETASKWDIIADSARPETIDYVRRHGFPRIRRSMKGKNSVEDGIEFIRGFEKVIIHPRCKHTIEEFKTYSYKTDSRTGLPTPKLEDAHNHLIDALRYALEPVRKGRTVVELDGRLL